MFPIPTIPIIAHRRALKCKAEEECKTEAESHEAGYFDYLSHSVGREYAQVEEEKAYFDDGDAGDVKKLLDIEYL